MPPSIKTTKEEIVRAAFEIVREQGAEALSVRAVAKALGCSTQPVMYHFGSIAELKKEVYIMADNYHTRYITTPDPASPMQGVGLAYIRFAREEKHLFRFLFQSDAFAQRSLDELIAADELTPVLEAISRSAHISVEQARSVFRVLFLLVHGYASMFANNAMTGDETTVAGDLKLVFDRLLAENGEE